MKRILSSILAFTVLFASTLILTSAKSPVTYENVFPFGTFEEDGGWTPDGNYFPGISTDEAHSGNSSYHVTPGWDFATTVSDSFAVKPNTDYMVALFYKGAPAWASIKLNNGTSDITEKNFGGEIPTEWTQFTHSFNSGNATSMRLKIMIYAGSDFYVDDIRIIERPDNTGNMIYNGSFDNQSNGWPYNGWGKNDGVNFSTAVNELDGTNCLHITPKWNDVYYAFNEVHGIEPNTDYEVSFIFKGKPGWDLVKIDFYQDSQWVSVVEKALTEDKGEELSTFRSYKMRFNSGDCTNFYVGFRMFSDTELYIDDVMCKKAVFADVNDDGAVDLLDLVRMKKHIADSGVALKTVNSDLNADDKIDASDLVILRRILLDTKSKADFYETWLNTAG